MNRDVFRALLAAGAALLALPACHDDGDGGGGSFGSTTLFSDDFERQDVGSGWTADSPSGGVAIQDDGGKSGGGLVMSAGAADGASSAQTVMTFPARPVTFTADVSNSAAGQGTGGVEIVDGSGAVVASAGEFGGAGGGYTFEIGGDVQAVPSAGAGAFRNLAFTVDEQGNGTWSADGGQVITRSGVPAGPLSVRLFTRNDGAPASGGSFPAFTFDNVNVSGGGP